MRYGWDDISFPRRAIDRAVSGWVGQSLEFLAAHWLFLINFANFAVLGIAVLVPVMAHFGLTALSASLFEGYHALCHQLPNRSDFLLGYQIAVCQRDVAIYASMGLAGIAFAKGRNRLRALPWWAYILLNFPLAVDGFTQLLGWRESNWALRTNTGVIFGISTIWLAYPYLESQMQQLRHAVGTRNEDSPPLTP